MFPKKSRLFDWDDRLTVISGDGTSTLVLSCKRGWVKVLGAGVSLGGRPIDEDEARSAFGPELEAFGTPPIAERQSSTQPPEQAAKTPPLARRPPRSLPAFVADRVTLTQGCDRLFDIFGAVENDPASGDVGQLACVVIALARDLLGSMPARPADILAGRQLNRYSEDLPLFH